jgi:predicted nucleic acid-binding protein
MIRTYVDSDILIAAAKGNDTVSPIALAILSDPNREFVSSMYIVLETLASTAHNGYDLQCEFYEDFLSDVTDWAECTDDLMIAAFQHMVDEGMKTVDALHVACATSL